MPWQELVTDCFLKCPEISIAENNSRDLLDALGLYQLSRTRTFMKGVDNKWLTDYQRPMVDNLNPFPWTIPSCTTPTLTWHRFATVDLVGPDGMAVEVSHRLDGERLRHANSSNPRRRQGFRRFDFLWDFPFLQSLQLLQLSYNSSACGLCPSVYRCLYRV